MNDDTGRLYLMDRTSFSPELQQVNPLKLFLSFFQANMVSQKYPAFHFISGGAHFSNHLTLEQHARLLRIEDKNDTQLLGSIKKRIGDFRRYPNQMNAEECVLFQIWLALSSEKSFLFFHLLQRTLSMPNTELFVEILQQRVWQKKSTIYLMSDDINQFVDIPHLLIDLNQLFPKSA